MSEGLEEPVVIGNDPTWTVIVDSIDGTRGLMYDKRPAWSLAAAAPRGGTLRDVVAAAMTELPTTKQGLADQLSGTRGNGVVAERIDLHDGTRAPIAVRPSGATDLEHGFAAVAKFFIPGKVALAQLETELFARLGSHHVFDDEYISSGGQLHELSPDATASSPTSGRSSTPMPSPATPMTSAPPCSSRKRVAWSPTARRAARRAARHDDRGGLGGYANPTLAAQIGPILAELVDDLRSR